MTTHDREAVIAAAKEAGFCVRDKCGVRWLSETDDLGPVERFYTISFEAGRQAEREECAVESEKQGEDEPYGHAKFRCYNIAEAIRARGEVK